MRLAALAWIGLATASGVAFAQTPAPPPGDPKAPPPPLQVPP